jgi:mannose/fructose-specific phosphotransferase system component IIA
MHIGVLVLTHDDFAAQLLNKMVAGDDDTALPMRAMAIHPGIGADVLEHHLGLKLAELDQGAGVLLLCDEVGAALGMSLPRLARRLPLAVVSGINHAMVYAVLAAPELDLQAACALAMKTGREAIQTLALPRPA